MNKLLPLMAVCVLLSACADTKPQAPKEGRIAIKNMIEAGVEKSAVTVSTSLPRSDFDWSQNNGNAQNLIPHGKMKETLESAWTRRIGKGISGDYLLLPEPIVFNGVIYALDGSFKLSAVEETSGQILWQTALPMNADLGLASIGLAADSGGIYAVGGNGVIYAVGFNGNVLWENNTGSILRSAPTLANGILYVMSGNNELFALSAQNGKELWRYRNIDTQTNLLGMGQPAVSKGVLVVPFSGGEIVAFDAKTGMILWSDELLSAPSYNKIQDISHVLAAPVIDGNTVYLVGNAQKTGAFDLLTGAVKYVQNIGGATTPLVNGNALFLITNRNTLAALEKATGKLIWETPLESHEEKHVVWNGPVLANNRLIVASNKGDVLLIEATSGAVKQKLKELGISNKPVLGKNKVILYTNKADLVAYE